MKKLFTFFCAMLFSTTVNAATYYVDKDSVGGACNDANNGTALGTPWCTIAKANSTLTAGDTVYIRLGTYAEDIDPANNGSAWDTMITYENYNSEAVTINDCQSQGGIEFNGNSYCKAKGFTVSCGDLTDTLYVSMKGAHHCWVEDITGTGNVDNCLTCGSYNNESESQYNVIKDCTFIDAGNRANEDCIVLGSLSHHNLVEGNTIGDTDHAPIYVRPYGPNQDNYMPYNNVIRNNTINNDIHAGITVSYVRDDGAGSPVRPLHLLENNTIYDCGQQTGGHGFQIHSSYTILRYNMVAGCGQATGDVSLSVVTQDFAGPMEGEIQYNRIYNNTFADSTNTLVAMKWVWHATEGNVWYMNKFLNNIVYNPSSTYEFQFEYNNLVTAPGAQDTWDFNLLGVSGDIARYNDEDSGVQTRATLAELVSELDEIHFLGGNIQGDPLFNDAASNDYTLKALSPCINTAGSLTTIAAADTGSGTTLVVEDALFFQDGMGLDSEQGVAADFIAVGTVDNTVQISSINYATNTITLASGITRGDADEVWPYKDSDGTIVLYGSAPEMGAYEAVPGGATFLVASVSPTDNATDVEVWDNIELTLPRFREATYTLFVVGQHKRVGLIWQMMTR
jgi:hypothetical protein